MIYNKYDLIYTDPPWRQGRGGKTKARPNSSGMPVPYDTMPLHEIALLHKYVSDNLVNEKHNVFMWTIEKYLPQTEQMMASLGYTLHARLIWDKGNGPSPAFTLRFSHEYLLWLNLSVNAGARQGPASSIYNCYERGRTTPLTKARVCLSVIRNIIPRSQEVRAFRKEHAGRMGLMGK